MKELLILTPIAYITEYLRWTIRNLHTDKKALKMQSEEG